MNPFLFKSPTKVRFGEGSSLELAGLLAELGAEKPMVVSGPNVSKTPGFAAAMDALKQKGVEPVLFLKAATDPPVEDVDEAAGVLRDSGCDAVIAVGGGSPIDTAKAISMLAKNPGSVREYLFGGSKTVENPSLPLICVPTTAGSGSEVTAASVITDNQKGVKLSVTHENLFPRYAVIDPALHKDMPAGITATTGMDALTHAIEAYVSKNAGPISDAYAEKAIKLIGANLKTAFAQPDNKEARSAMAVASCMAATAFVNGGLGAVHGITQSMGGIAHVAHGLANAMMLAPVMEKNLPGNLKKFAAIAFFMGADTAKMTDEEAAKTAVEQVKALSGFLGIPRKLSAVGVTAGMFPSIVKGTMEYRLMAVNPVKLTEDDIYDILEKNS